MSKASVLPPQQAMRALTPSCELWLGRRLLILTARGSTPALPRSAGAPITRPLHRPNGFLVTSGANLSDVRSGSVMPDDVRSSAPVAAAPRPAGSSSIMCIRTRKAAVRRSRTFSCAAGRTTSTRRGCGLELGVRRSRKVRVSTSFDSVRSARCRAPDSTVLELRDRESHAA